MKAIALLPLPCLVAASPFAPRAGGLLERRECAANNCIRGGLVTVSTGRVLFADGFVPR